jgi:hypothetical protein
MRERSFILVVGNDQLGEFSRGRIGIRGEKPELQSKSAPGKREHLPELTCAEYSDDHVAAGSG